MNSKNIDLNLIRTLILLEKHRNIKNVALELDKTESAVSKYLSKLREQLNDYLFIRSNQGLVPTYKLRLILPNLKNATNMIDSVLSNVDESILIPSISIAFHSGILELYGSELYRALNEKLPESKISFHQWSENTLNDITSHKIDLGIHFYDETRSKIFNQNHLFNDELVICYFSEVELTRKEILKRNFSICKFHGENDYKLEKLDVTLKNDNDSIRLSYMDNYTLLIDMLKNNDHNTVLPLSVVPKIECKYIPLFNKGKYNVEICSVHSISEDDAPITHDILSTLKDFIKETF